LNIRAQYLFAPFAIALFASPAAFGSTTAYNGYVQTSGNSGVDLNTLNGGNYSITVTRTGQLNFRFTMGGQTFDSNPEVSLFQLPSNDVGSDAAPIAYSRASTAPDPVAESLISYDSWVPSVPSVRVAQAAVDPGLSSGPIGGTSDNTAAPLPINSGVINGANYDVSSLMPAVAAVPASSFTAYVGDGGGGGSFTIGPISVFAEEAPEPGTLILFAGAVLLGGISFLIRRTRV